MILRKLKLNYYYFIIQNICETRRAKIESKDQNPGHNAVIMKCYLNIPKYISRNVLTESIAM